MLYNILKKSSELYKDNIAVNFNNQRITYESLYDKVSNMSDILLSNGVGKGDHVAIIMNNGIEFIEGFFAANMSSAVILPIYINSGINKLKNILNKYDVKYVMTQKSQQEQLNLETLKECTELKGIFYIGNSDDEYVRFEGTSQGNHYDNLKENSDFALMLFSSGTTNTPKGIMLSNANIESNVSAISDYLQLDDKDKILLVKNLNHASSITGEMLVSIYNGCELVLSAGWPTSSNIINLIYKEKITVFFAVPTLLMALLNHRNLDHSKLESLKTINFYGATLHYEEIQRFANTFPAVELIYSYGLTEAAPRVTYIYKEKLLEKKGSSGTPINGVQVFICDNEGKEVSDNETGEIVVKGPNVMMSYYKNSELTKKTLRDDALYTSDIGYLDSDGFLYVIGRRDNMIVQAGKNIHPEEIEEVIRSFSGVNDVLVKGEDDDFLGKKIVAYVTSIEGFELDFNDILQHCRLNLEDYKIPRDFYLTDHLEKTQSGKILRKQDIKTAI